VNPSLTELSRAFWTHAPVVKPQVNHAATTPRGELRKTGRAPSSTPEEPDKTAGQSPFCAGSRIATHSTCDVIGNMPHEARPGEKQVRGCFSPGGLSAPERQTSVTNRERPTRSTGFQGRPGDGTRWRRASARAQITADGQASVIICASPPRLAKVSQGLGHPLQEVFCERDRVLRMSEATIRHARRRQCVRQAPVARSACGLMQAAPFPAGRR